MKVKCTLFLLLLTTLSLLAPFTSKANFGSNSIHDPSSIVKFNGLYHVYGTGNQITHLTSADLVNWTAAPAVFSPGTWPSWINTYVSGFAGNFWAPEIVNVNGTYYLYYACSTGGNVAAIGLATSTDLITWTDRGMVINSTGSSNFSAVDPAMFVDATGNWWLTLGSHYTGIYIVQLDPTTGKRLNTTITNIAGSSNGDHAGSNITYENGHYYLFYNTGQCCNSVNSTTQIRVGRSLNPTGPYVDKSGVALRGGGGGTIVLSTSGKYVGPAQFGLLKEAGRSMVTTHYYDRTSSGTPRLDQAKLTFGADGWPVITRDVLPNGRYRIKNKNSGLYWQAQGCTGLAGQKLVQATLSTTDICQQWDLTSAGDGFYKLKNGKAGTAEQVVDLPFCASDNGTLLQTWDWLNNDCQKFKIEGLADGSYVFSTTVNANKVIEVPACSPAAGTQLVLWDYNGFVCQQWILEPVTATEPPVAQTATNITTNGFTANWAPVAGASNYRLDVSANANFTSLIAGYNNLTVAGTSAAIAGLSANAFYYYRVRAVKNGEESFSSGAIAVYTAGAVDNGMHDPSSLVKEVNLYWTYGTGYSNGDGSIVPFTISFSNDLYKWTRSSKPVFAEGKWPSWITAAVPNFGGIFWAPEVFFMNGKYYLYYSVSAFGSPISVIGLATSPTLDPASPEYGWTDQGMVVSSSSQTDVNAIDAAILKDTDGRLWMSFGSFAGGLGVVELDPVTGLRKEGAAITVIAGGNRSAWEAPYILKEGNYYYLFANRQYCCTLLNSTYYLVAGRSTSITGPYVDKNGNSLRVTSSGTVVGTTVLESSGKFVGPGHFGLLKDGARSLVSTHYYDNTSNGYPRLDIAQLKFSDDGWPIITRDVLPEGRYKIANKNSGLVWETAGCTGAGGQQLVQNTAGENALCQLWDLTPVGDGFYRLKSANGGVNTQVVDIPFCDVRNKLATWDWLNNDCQKFKIDQLANGSYVFSNANGSHVIEVPNASAAPNVQLGLWPFNEAANQQWSIDPVRLAPVAIEAENIAPTSFEAKWNAVPNATSYKVDVFTAVNNSAVPATTVAGWNFEAENNGANTGIQVNVGKTLVTGGGTGAVTYVSSAGSNGVTAQATGWNSGNETKYWEAVNISTKGHYSLNVSSRQRSNSTGPRHFKLQYKIGASGAYADVPGSYVTTADNYSSGILSNVQLPAVCDNQPSVYLRWLQVTNTAVGNNSNAGAGGISGSTGQSNIDDIIISGVASPSYTFVQSFDDVSVNGASLSITGLNPNTTYYYQVRSVVGGVTSENSNVSSVKTACETVMPNATITQVHCNGGNDGVITLAVTGGAKPYTYSWTGPNAIAATTSSVSDLKAGDYNVRITQNNGCVSDFTYTVTEPAVLTAYAVAGTVACHGGTTTVTIGAAGGTAPYKGTGQFTVRAGTHMFTVTDDNGCTASTTVNVTEPSAVSVTVSNSNPQLYFGFAGDQRTTIRSLAMGGTAPYKISITMNRPLKCNSLNDAGDEVWSASGGSSVNNTCPANPGTNTVAPVSVITGLAEGEAYSIDLSLMANATITVTVTDAAGCTTSSSTKVLAEDVRCLSGNSGNAKVAICHRTGSSKNPCVSICVDQANVAEHLAHGDYLGSCMPDCAAPASTYTTIKQVEDKDNTAEGELELSVRNNPSYRSAAFKLSVFSSRAEAIHLRIFDGNGRLLMERQNLRSGQVLEVGATFAQGMYVAEAVQGRVRKVLKLVKQ